MFSGHLETILPALLRKAGNVIYTRERILTPDDDFLDLDWSKTGADKLVIISHGLEGDSQRAYVKGMVKAFNLAGWDAVAWNYRGCSGEMNKLKRFYHSGETKDLDHVVDHVLKDNHYVKAALVGFSIGGNITLKYLGEKEERIHPLIKAAVTFSVPCHLEAGAMHLARRSNKIYLNRFLQSLKLKIKNKELCLPGSFDLKGLEKVSSFLEFDEKYTAPMHGFRSAKDYWTQSSSIFYLHGIRIPTLLVNARNDPFLPKECFPVKEAQSSTYLYLEMPSTGGHVGFFHNKTRGFFWSEQRAIEFIKNYA